MNEYINEKFNTIVLASASPRRKDILREAGLEPLIIKPECDETLPLGIEMQDAVMFLALKKALWVEHFLCTQAFLYDAPLIIAADTVVYCNGIIGKPIDKEDAYRILSMLRAREHFVATGVALIDPQSGLKRAFCEVTKVFFKDYTEEALLAYIDTEEPYDKAGGYAIQETFSKYINRIEGDLHNVIGLPLRRLLAETNKL